MRREHNPRVFGVHSADAGHQHLRSEDQAPSGIEFAPISTANSIARSLLSASFNERCAVLKRIRKARALQKGSIRLEFFNQLEASCLAYRHSREGQEISAVEALMASWRCELFGLTKRFPDSAVSAVGTRRNFLPPVSSFMASLGKDFSISILRAC